MSGISIPATHSIWGKGVINSHPIWSNMIQGYVLMFKPDMESFTIPVPADEFEMGDSVEKPKELSWACCTSTIGPVCEHRRGL